MTGNGIVYPDLIEPCLKNWELATLNACSSRRLATIASEYNLQGYSRLPKDELFRLIYDHMITSHCARLAAERDTSFEPMSPWQRGLSLCSVWPATLHTNNCAVTWDWRWQNLHGRWLGRTGRQWRRRERVHQEGTWLPSRWVELEHPGLGSTQSNSSQFL